ncbi:response regulator transcription factor [Empedobacter falsenii]|uniref:Response regulator transcription factor n=1 Tax=Empedobacter falsenii TaxID=343874 RepID=A0ABY8V7H4_9FLAO|nr:MULTISPECIES: response regulator transcription factor [Empedobacter]MDM1522018.1 response regulator transcription factor [Empedobacter sp. 225-1]MDM1542287.1 response regulator transcription factor [Empedobacter sp. 189-2]WIH97536.1 response regulator transcription factor [Empedobacter falsenii]
MKIFILDQHQIVIDGLISLLHKRRNYQIIGYSTNINEAILWLSRNEVDLIITEITFNNDDAIDLIKTIKKHHDSVKILILTGDNRIKKVAELFKLGINGFLEKHNETKSLIEAIQCISKGESYMGEDLKNRIIQNFSNENKTGYKNLGDVLDSITNRELEVIQLICDGYNSKEISSKLFISFNTVETHRKRIFQKLQIKNSIGLIKFAIKHDLIE